MHNGMHYTVLRSAAESAQPQFFFAKKAAPCLWGLYLQALLGRAVNVKRKLGLWPQGATSEEPGASRDNGSIAPPSTYLVICSPGTIRTGTPVTARL